MQVSPAGHGAKRKREKKRVGLLHIVGNESCLLKLLGVREPGWRAGEQPMPSVAKTAVPTGRPEDYPKL